MTLLIGTASDKHVFLTSDRRCTVKGQGMVSRCGTLQKIFPIPDKPLALVHHGENVFLDEAGNEVLLSEFVTAFIRDNRDVFEQPSVESMTAKLAEMLEPIAERTLVHRGEKLIGFWVAGFGGQRTRPEIWEVCWFKSGRKELKFCHNLVVGGDGKDHLPPDVRDRLDGMYNVTTLPKASVEKAKRYHDKLFAIALKPEPEPRRFSEKRDQLVIEKEGWRWVTPPVSQERTSLGPRNEKPHSRGQAMSERARLVGGPGDGEIIPVEKEMVGLPLDRNLALLKARAEPYAFAIYRLDRSGDAPVYRFVSAQRKEAEKAFEVEFVDGPMQGVRPFGHAIQLSDMTIRFPLDADHKPVKKGAKVAAIAEYKRRKIDGVWKMALAGIIDSEGEAERSADIIAEKELTRELQIYTSDQLVEELLGRPGFVGVIAMYPGELVGDWQLEEGSELILGIGKQLNEEKAKVILRSALESLDRRA